VYNKVWQDARDF